MAYVWIAAIQKFSTFQSSPAGVWDIILVVHKIYNIHHTANGVIYHIIYMVISFCQTAKSQ